MHAVNSALVALPLPRHGELGAADLATSSTGIDIPVLPIEGVRTHALFLSLDSGRLQVALPVAYLTTLTCA